MKNVTEKEILDYAIKLVELYKNEIDLIKKEKIAKDFYSYVTYIEYLIVYSFDDKVLDFFDKFHEYYINEIRNYIHLGKIFSMQKVLEEKKEEERIKQFNKDEIKYIIYLIDKIHSNSPKNNKTNYNPDYLITNYIKSDNDILNYFKSLKDNIWYNESFNNSTMLKLHSTDDMILLNKYDVSVLFHEFMHLYSERLKENFNDTKYRETSALIGEVAINNYYGIKSEINVLNELKSCTFNNYLDDISFIPPVNLYYIIGMIISVPFIYKNGNDFKTVKNAIDVLVNNSNIDFMQMLDKLNINEQDIIVSFDSMNQKLKFKKR